MPWASNLTRSPIVKFGSTSTLENTLDGRCATKSGSPATSNWCNDTHPDLGFWMASMLGAAHAFQVVGTSRIVGKFSSSDSPGKVAIVTISSTGNALTTANDRTLPRLKSPHPRRVVSPRAIGGHKARVSRDR